MMRKSQAFALGVLRQEGPDVPTQAFEETICGLSQRDQTLARAIFEIVQQDELDPKANLYKIARNIYLNLPEDLKEYLRGRPGSCDPHIKTERLLKLFRRDGWIKVVPSAYDVAVRPSPINAIGSHKTPRRQTSKRTARRHRKQCLVR